MPHKHRDRSELVPFSSDFRPVADVGRVDGHLGQPAQIDTDKADAREGTFLARKVRQAR